MASSVKYHKTYLKLHKEYEAYAYPIIKKALDDQTGAVADFVNEDTFDNIELYIQFLVQQRYNLNRYKRSHESYERSLMTGQIIVFSDLILAYEYNHCCLYLSALLCCFVGNCLLDFKKRRLTRVFFWK